jgi:cytochrome c oxidase assembly protein subunit 15
MGGQITPPETFNISSIIEQQAWIQFIHRWIAIAAGGLILAFAYRVKAWPLALMVIAQIGLGIATLLTGVHIHVAATHQAGAIILTALLLSQLHRFYYVHR